MTELHLVRHGRVRPDDGPAAGWVLHPDAKAGFDDLSASGALPGRAARWFSSPEPKAFATARALTDTAVGLVDGLREMERPAEVWRPAEEWGAMVGRSMTEPDVPAAPGWETATATTDRVLAALGRIQGSCPDDDLVLVGHGTAWTLLVAALTGRPPDVGAWSRLRLPDHCVVDLSVGELQADPNAAYPRSGQLTGELTAPWGHWCATESGG